MEYFTQVSFVKATKRECPKELYVCDSKNRNGDNDLAWSIIQTRSVFWWYSNKEVYIIGI